MGTIDATDREALERCLVAARAEDAGRRAQIDAMLADPSRTWQEVAVFACTCAQYRSLDLPPWQNPVLRAKPYGDPSGKGESAELLKRLLDAGLSPIEPDPLQALRSGI